jgi:hypothetical protein
MRLEHLIYFLHEYSKEKLIVGAGLFKSLLPTGILINPPLHPVGINCIPAHRSNVYNLEGLKATMSAAPRLLQCCNVADLSSVL